MKFTITDIVKERTPFGNTVYKAIAEDGRSVKTGIPNAITPSRELLMSNFLADYYNSVKIHSRDTVKIGDVLES